MRNAGLDESQAGIKIAERNTNNLRYVDDITVMAESEEKLKSLLMKVKDEHEKAGLKLSGPQAVVILVLSSTFSAAWEDFWFLAWVGGSGLVSIG